MTPEQRSRAMQRVKLKDGPLEMAVQQRLSELGLRFHRHCPELPGKPDIVFKKHRVAIFVDGDFWHGYRLPVWEKQLTPFWKTKLNANRRRDRRNFCKLRLLEWKVVRIWEHQLKRDPDLCIRRILRALRTVFIGSEPLAEPRPRRKRCDGF